MRLICPNCGAQYEVADDAIPENGRDVQCSNCSHAWFQGRDKALEQAATADESDDLELISAVAAETVPDTREPEPQEIDFDAPSQPPSPEAEAVAEAASEPDPVLPETEPPGESETIEVEPLTEPEVATSPDPEAATDVVQAAEDAVATAEDEAASAIGQMMADASKATSDEASDDAVDSDDLADPDDDLPAPGLPPVADTAQVDENLLAILREEAEREVAQRRAEAPQPIEVQTDLGLDATPAAAPAVATAAAVTAAAAAARFGRKAPDFSHLSSDSDDHYDELVASEDVAVAIPQAGTRPATRRDLLPDVEEISSTLRSSRSVVDDDDNPMPDLPMVRRKKSGFRSGFLLSVLIASLVMVTYILAPTLAEQFPAAKGSLEAYVEGVNRARSLLGSMLASLTGLIEGRS